MLLLSVALNIRIISFILNSVQQRLVLICLLVFSIILNVVSTNDVLVWKISIYSILGVSAVFKVSLGALPSILVIWSSLDWSNGAVMPVREDVTAVLVLDGSSWRLFHLLDRLSIVVYNVALIREVCVKETTKDHYLVIWDSDTS